MLACPTLRSRPQPIAVHQQNRKIWTISIAFAILSGVVGLGSANAQMSEQDLAEVAAIELPEDPATLVAMVGQQQILLGELMPKIEARLNAIAKQSPTPIPPDQLRIARNAYFKQLLDQTIQIKMLRQSFLLDKVGTAPFDKRRDAEQQMTDNARKLFVNMKLPELKKSMKTESLSEIDRKLREQGSSLKALEYEFIDQMLSHLYLQDKVDRDPEISIAEIIQYYRAHESEFEHSARARWEQLTVNFENFDSRESAYQAIWEMLQEARFGGSMQAVARAKSQEPFAKGGGVHEWTNRGSLASEVLDEQIFRLPLAQISDVIEDTAGFHVIRVLEREAAGVTALSQVQDKIRTKLRRQKVAAAEQRVMKELTQSVAVWSMFPEFLPYAKPLPNLARRPGSSVRR